jgi:inosine-uridine nucleoside N-ribohydrolase
MEISKPFSPFFILYTPSFPLTLVGLDVTLQTLLPQHEVDKWREQGTELGTFMADMTGFYMEAYRNFRPCMIRWP